MFHKDVFFVEISSIEVPLRKHLSLGCGNWTYPLLAVLERYYSSYSNSGLSF